MTAALAPGLHPVPAGHLAAVVTHLEMTEPAPLRPATPPDGVTLEPHAAPDVEWYRDLFYRVGGQDWLWTSRMVMDRDLLRATLADADVHVWSVRTGGYDEGLLELDFRQPGACELAFFGLTRALIGTGAGRWLMNAAIERAWAAPISRFTVHTCTLDHPGALGFYTRSGFRPVRQEIEIMPDPRASGIYPADAAPQIPAL